MQNISYYIASCMFHDTCKVKCPVSSAKSMFSFIPKNMNVNLAMFYYTDTIFKKV